MKIYLFGVFIVELVSFRDWNALNNHKLCDHRTMRFQKLTNATMKTQNRKIFILYCTLCLSSYLITEKYMCCTHVIMVERAAEYYAISTPRKTYDHQQRQSFSYFIARKVSVEHLMRLSKTYK